MRILIVGPLLDVRGPIPRIVQLTAQELTRRGCEVDVVHWGQRGAGESLLAKLTARPRDAARIVRAMDRGAYSLAYVHSAHDTRALLRELPLVLGANRRRLPVFYMFHGTPDRDHGSVQDRIWRTLFGFLVRRMAGVLVLSHAEKHFIERWYPGVRVWATRYPFRVELDGYASGGNANPPTLIFVGRVIPEKGILELIQALPLVLQHTACRLVVCGDGSALPQARHLADTVGVADCVDFLGWQTQAATWSALTRADVAVLPTHREGFPSAILEAMAAGLPIVTTRTGGIPDYLHEGLHARFVPPRDPPALAATLAQTLCDPALRARMGEANRALVQKFAPEPVIDEYLAMFRAQVGGD